MESLIEVHKKYPFQIPTHLKDKMRNDHIKLVYPKYHQLLTNFLALKIEAEKNKFFKYYANDFQNVIETQFLK